MGELDSLARLLKAIIIMQIKKAGMQHDRLSAKNRNACMLQNYFTTKMLVCARSLSLSLSLPRSRSRSLSLSLSLPPQMWTIGICP